MRFKHKYAIPAWTCLTLYGSRDRNVKFSSKVYCTVAVGIGKGASRVVSTPSQATTVAVLTVCYR